MTLVARLRPAVPVAVALAGVLVTFGVASRVLPGRVVLVHLSETGGDAFAASRADLLLLGFVLVVGIVVTWLVAAFFLAVTPTRHLLVPHASFWKHPSNRAEMRRRYARYLAVATSASLWFVALLYLIALVSQGTGPLAAWWLPAAASAAFVLFVLGGIVWVFTAGFTPPPRSAGAAVTRAAGREARGDGRPSAEVVASPGPRSEGPRPAGPSPAGPRSPVGRPVTDRPRAATPATPPPSTAATPRPVPRRPGGPSADGARKGPPRPYQPRPRSGGPRG